MSAAKAGSHVSQTSAQVILEVAKVISAHLELPDVLEALITRLEPMVHFDAIGVAVLEGDYAKLHSVHIEGLHRQSNESAQSIVARKALDLNIEPLKTRIPVHEHPMSVV